MNDAHSPDTVIRLAQEGRLEEWVHTFLESIGGNVPMSDGLRLQPRFWVGPVVIPLDRLARGWAPPPLIAQFLPDFTLSLRDGNHRHEALRRAGRQGYWCVLWCDSAELRREAERALADVL